MAGPPPNPLERKRRLGNPGHQPLPELRPIPGFAPAPGAVPDPVRVLGQLGRDAWDRCWRLAGYWLGAGDVEVAQLLAESVDERGQLRAMVFADGGNIELRRAMRALDAQLIRLCSLLGFSPTDRQRLGLGEVKMQTDLERFRADVARRRAAQLDEGEVIDVDPDELADDDPPA